MATDALMLNDLFNDSIKDDSDFESRADTGRHGPLTGTESDEQLLKIGRGLYKWSNRRYNSQKISGWKMEWPHQRSLREEAERTAVEQGDGDEEQAFHRAKINGKKKAKEKKGRKGKRGVQEPQPRQPLNPSILSNSILTSVLTINSRYNNRLYP